MPEPTNEEIVLRAEKLAAESGLDWVSMFCRASERADRATVGDGQREAFMAAARKELVAERARKPKD